MTNIWTSNFNVGDKVLYLGSKTIPYDKDGNELNVELNRGKIYTVKEVLILSIKIEELETKTIECQECLGTGKIEKLICTKPVSECCGGCYTYKECSNCGGSGEVEIEIERYDRRTI